MPETLRVTKKRVRFGSTEAIDSDPSSSAESRPIKRRIVELLPLCSDLSEREKRDRWIRPGEFSAIRASIMQQTGQYRKEGLAVPAAQTYVQLYSVCQQHWERDDKKESLLPGSLLLPLSSMAGGPCSEMRGLEDRMVPWVGIRRRIDRIKIIRAVVKAQQKNAHLPDDVRAISRLLTKPARQLGQVLAVADATAAMLEYESTRTEEEGAKPETSNPDFVNM